MSTIIERGDTLKVRGTLDITSAIVNAKTGQFSREFLELETLTPTAVSLSEAKQVSDITASLPAVASGGDMGLTQGTFGVDAVRLQTSNSSNTTVTQKVRFSEKVKDNWEINQDIGISIRAVMTPAAADESAILDVEAYVSDGEGGIGADICTTSPQDMNNITYTEHQFELNSSGLARGDEIDFVVTISIADGATATAVIGEIGRISMIADIRG